MKKATVEDGSDVEVVADMDITRQTLVVSIRVYTETGPKNWRVVLLASEVKHSVLEALQQKLHDIGFGRQHET